MPELLSDGTISWFGGMDTSRSAAEISDIQYSNASNVIIPNSLGGIRCRFGLHCSHLTWDSDQTKEIYEKGNLQAEGFYSTANKDYLVILMDGWVLRFEEVLDNGFYVKLMNPYDRNRLTRCYGWIITIPNGCIINNAFDYPFIIQGTGMRRSDPSKSEIGIGRMGVYVQNRLFVVDQSGTQILASDFRQPLMFTNEDTNIFGFMCPDEDEKITAVAKQKSILGTVEGGNLIWSSTKDIYSTDVRGTRTEWATLGSRVGKTSETVPGFSAASSYSFEPFNTNLYFRTKHFGISDLKQSEYQFVNLDAVNNQSIEASLYLDNDTEWMLDQTYTRASNNRLFTTVAPETNKEGYIYWNGILSFCPSAVYSNQGQVPRRFESVFTGVRPWSLTVVTNRNTRDRMFIHSFDKDGTNRLYLMNEFSDYDIDPQGNMKEIEGFIETRAFTHKNPLLKKLTDSRFYELGYTERTTTITLFSRPDPVGEWIQFFTSTHLIGRARVENGAFIPESTQGQTRVNIMASNEEKPRCQNDGSSFLALQYRVEFKGPVNLNAIVSIASVTGPKKTVYQKETKETRLIYEHRKTFNFSIAGL